MYKRSFAKACLLLRVVSQVSVAAHLPLDYVALFNNECHTALNKIHPFGRYLQPLTWEGSLLCRAYRDAGSWFLLSDPNDHQMSSSFSRLVRRATGTEDLFLPGSPRVSLKRRNSVNIYGSSNKLYLSNETSSLWIQVVTGKIKDEKLLLITGRLKAVGYLIWKL